MKIAHVEPLWVQPGSASEPGWVFVKVTTDTGLVGWGEALGEHGLIMSAAVSRYGAAILGEDPERVVHLWQSMYRGSVWRGGPVLNGAYSGIEMALWDIKGKALGVPVWQLLGGRVRDRIRAYAHARGGTPDIAAAHARSLVAQGYTAVKHPPADASHSLDSYRVIRDGAERVRAIRDAVGPDIDVMLDFHGMFSPAMSVLMEQEVRQFKPFFIEEPVLPHNTPELARLSAKFITPIATGERLFTRWDFRTLLESGAASVVQPDPAVCGGIFELRQIAAMAEAYNVGLAPHNALGPISTAAALQIAACTPNFIIQEITRPEALGEGGYLRNPFVVDEGFIAIPDQPGLGIDVDEEFLASIPYTGPEPIAALWHHPADGTVVEP